MKKILSLVLVLCIVFSVSVSLGEEISSKVNGTIFAIDPENPGYVKVIAPVSAKRIKLQVSYGDTRFVYDLTHEEETLIPLQMGAGEYFFELCRQVKGNQYKLVASYTVSITDEEAEAWRLLPNQMIPAANAEMEETASSLCEGLSDKQKVSAVKKWITKNFAYDFVKSLQVEPGVLPDIDGCWQKHMGICQDLSAVMVAMLRSQGVPCSPVVGTYNGGAHAWVKVWVNGKSYRIDPTVDIVGNSGGSYKTERWY